MIDWRRGLAWLFVAGIGIACASAEAPGLNERLCASDSDCQRERCIEFRCVPPGSGRLEAVDLEITPPIHTPYRRTQALGRRIDRVAEPLPIELARATEITYSVLGAGDRPVAARVAIRGAPRIPGREIDFSATYAGQGPETLALLPGVYSVVIEPLASDLPGIAISGWEVRESAGVVPKEFRLPEPYPTLPGLVTARGDAKVKVANVKVRAFAVPSGLASSTAVTAEDGAFLLRLPETDETTYRLVAEAATQPAWGYEQIITIQPGDDRFALIPLEETPDSARFELALRVLGMDDAGPQPVIGAIVNLRAHSAVESKVFRATGKTDGTGTVRDGGSEPLRLVSARYQVEVVPPGQSPFARGLVALDLSSSTNSRLPDEQIKLEKRVRTSGLLFTASGHPLGDAAVELTPLGTTGRLAAAVTDETGTFVVWLDPGRYLMRVDPGSNLGRQEIIPVGLFPVEVPAASSHDLAPNALPAGATLGGRITARGGSDAIPDTEVELFVRHDGIAVSIGRAIADVDGRFSLAVPVP